MGCNYIGVRRRGRGGKWREDIARSQKKIDRSEGMVREGGAGDKGVLLCGQRSARMVGGEGKPTAKVGRRTWEGSQKKQKGNQIGRVEKGRWNTRKGNRKDNKGSVGALHTILFVGERGRRIFSDIGYDQEQLYILMKEGHCGETKMGAVSRHFAKGTDTHHSKRDAD